MPGGAASGWLPTHMGRVILVRGVIGRQPPGSIQIHSVRKVVVYQTPSIVVVAPCTSEPPCTSSTIHDLLGTRPCFLLAVPICHHTLGAASHAITAPVRPANTHRGRVREPPGVVGRGRGQLDVARSPVGRRLQRLALDLRITVPLLAAPRLQQAPLPRGVSLLTVQRAWHRHGEVHHIACNRQTKYELCCEEDDTHVQNCSKVNIRSCFGWSEFCDTHTHTKILLQSFSSGCSVKIETTMQVPKSGPFIKMVTLELFISSCVLAAWQRSPIQHQLQSLFSGLRHCLAPSVGDAKETHQFEAAGSASSVRVPAPASSHGRTPIQRSIPPANKQEHRVSEEAWYDSQTHKHNENRMAEHAHILT